MSLTTSAVTVGERRGSAGARRKGGLRIAIETLIAAQPDA
jgi:hypothetical protein